MRTPPLALALGREVGRAGGLGACVVAGLGALLLVGQTLGQAAFVPAPGGAALLAVGLVPAVLGVAVPAGLLVGALVAGRRCAEGGDAVALMASGYGQRRLGGPLLALGMLVAAFGWLDAGLLEPAGRRLARQALLEASDGLSLRAGQPVTVGETLLRAGRVEGEALGDLFVATDRVVVSASSGEVQAGALLVLGAGEARSVGEAPGELGWSLRFQSASLPLEVGARRVELAERSNEELRALIGRMEAAGRSAAPERLALYKRGTLPLGGPLLALLGLALGARTRRLGVAALATALGWWAAIRVCDQAVSSLGPGLAAALPLVALGLATGIAWATWRDA